jgi:hypothetical protein
MQCPRCGHNVDLASICPACDYVVDPSFLGNDFLDESTRADVALAAEALIANTPPSVFDAATVAVALQQGMPDPLILGDPTLEVNRFFNDKSDGFLTAKTSEGRRALLPTPYYIGADVEQCLAPDAVLARVSRAEPSKLRMSPFELIVWRQIDGQRPVARIEALMGLDAADVRMALALLVDKRMVERVGTAQAASLHADATARMPIATPTAGQLFDDKTAGELDVSLPSLLSLPSQDDALVMFEDTGVVHERKPTGVIELVPLSVEAWPPAPAMPPSVVVKPVATTPERPATMPTKPLMPKPMIPAVSVPSMASMADVERSPEMHASGEAALQAAAHYEQAMADLDAGNIARGFTFLRLAAERDPRNPTYHRALDDWDAMVMQRLRGNTNDPNRVFADALRAEQAGDFVRAIELLQSLTLKTPDSAALWNRLGVLLATRKKDIPAALHALGKALELEPNNPAYMNNFGKVATQTDKTPAQPKQTGIFGRWFGKKPS